MVVPHGMAASARNAVVRAGFLLRLENVTEKPCFRQSPIPYASSLSYHALLPPGCMLYVRISGIRQLSPLSLTSADELHPGSTRSMSPSPSLSIPSEHAGPTAAEEEEREEAVEVEEAEPNPPEETDETDEEEREEAEVDEEELTEEDMALLGVIDGSVRAAMEALGTELESYLKEAGEETFQKGFVKVPVREPGVAEPFIGILKGFKELFGVNSAPGKKPKADAFKLEKEKETAFKTAKSLTWAIYKNYKKAHKMVSW